MRLVVFTAMIGVTDMVRPPLLVNPDVRYVCFSDRPVAVAPYEDVRVPTTDQSRIASRRIKILADHPALGGAEALLWHDASYQLLSDPSWAIRRLARADLAALRHPSRTRIEDEAVAIARYGYVSLEVAHAHVARYRAEGFVDNLLTCTGLLARRVSDPIRQFNRLWWQEAQQWGGRDQGSVNFAAWSAGLRVKHVKGTIRHNAYARWRERPERVA